MTQSIVGIDVSILTLDIALLHESKAKYLKIKNNSSRFQRLHNWLLKHDCQQTHVCLEATGQYGFAVAGYLYAHEFQVSVVNPTGLRPMLY
jgi:transposase